MQEVPPTNVMQERALEIDELSNAGTSSKAPRPPMEWQERGGTLKRRPVNSSWEAKEYYVDYQGHKTSRMP